MADFTLRSLRGGLNNSDPAIAIGDDQCRVATNVEFNVSMLGERRRGTDAIDLHASITATDRVPFLYRHLPTSDETGSELWVMGFTASGAVLARKTTSWSTVTVNDAAVVTGFAPYQWNAETLHGKLFIAYSSDQDRLHVWDGTTFRRTGLRVPPAAPTGANTGAGTFAGTRYYRVRHVEMSGTTVLRRSEPSDVLTFAPSGTGAAARVSEPAGTNEGETHWELEASTDNALFYRIARTAIATTFYDDSQDFVTGYGAFTLSEDIEDYALIPSGRYLTADEDRLLIGGSWMDASMASRVMWTPVGNADGVGNDERLETDTDPSLDLDGYKGGPLTGLSSPVAGSVWAFKFNHIYKLVRSGKRSAAYDAFLYTDKRGALHGSVVEGVDQIGRPCVYFLDPTVGPCRGGASGVQQCGADIRETWKTLNIDATKVVCSGLYYPDNRQVIWCIATSDANIPNLAIVLQTNEMRDTEDGARKGWSIWTGSRASALAMCLYADNIDDNTARSRTLVPFIGLEGLGLVHRCDTGNDDNGVAYAARIVTKPFTLKSLLTKFGVTAGALVAKAVTGAKVTVKVIRDFGLETTATVSEVPFDATSTETDVIKFMDDLKGSEMRVAQFEFVDPATPGTRFELNQLTLIERLEQEN